MQLIKICTTKALLRGKYLALNACIRKEGRSKINNMNFPLSKLEKEQIIPKASRRKEIIKIKAQIDKIENRKAIETIKKIQKLFFREKKSIKLIKA